MGDNGIIDRGIEARFKSNLSQVEDKVLLYWSDKEAEAILLGTNPNVYEKLPIITEGDNESTVDKSEFKETLITEILEFSGKDDVEDVNLYQIDKTKVDYDSGHTYILDIDKLEVYDVEGEKFRGKMHHTLRGLGVVGEDEEEVEADTPIPEQPPEITMDGDIGWLKPNVSGYNRHYAYLAYYNKDNMDDVKYITTSDYIDPTKYNKNNKIEEDSKTYVLDGYKDTMWANLKSTGNGLETWWVWIPRYAYKIQGTSSNPAIDTVFIDMNNNPIGSRYEGKYTVNSDGTITINEETYIIHPCFTKVDEKGNTVQLQGIWMSKYEPTSTANANHNLDSGECYAPDMTGFDKNSTYIELYDSETGEFTSEVKLANADLKTINQNSEWYDYKSKIWANVKTNANGAECWWVWIPRYAYSTVPAEQEIEVIFVDTKNRPYDKEEYGSVLPKGLTVHPCFSVKGENGKTKELKGIWVSKYEPINTNNADLNATAGECLAPNMTGFDADNTYIELYNSETGEFTSEVKLADANLTTINDSKQWYNYSEKIWANVKTTANGLECWWVWVPRYAYSASQAGGEMDVVFVGLDNKPIDKTNYGKDLKSGMTVHPCFTKTDENGNTVELSGIWMSKYEPTWVN
ncbi:MAG: hypothetical protein J6M60_07050 [Clostridia bacterium]|nr:hypothetical protein [Clostridia bacterium]